MSYWIRNLPTYPQNGNHQEIHTDLHPFPIRITKGEDAWYYKDENDVEQTNKPKLWYVFQASGGYVGKTIVQTKGFRKPEVALRYAIRSYKKWLRMHLKHVNQFEIKES